MLRKLLIAITLIIEKSKEVGLLTALRRAVYHCEKAVPAYCDFSMAKLEKYSLPDSGYELKHIDQQNQVNDYVYSLKSRKLKVAYNLKKGCRSFVLIKEKEIIGDIWYIPSSASTPRPHPDLNLLGIDLGPQDVYAFDMHVSKTWRGKNMATAFMASVLKELRKMGYQRAYGFYESKNIPALWVHRLIGYIEMPAVGIKHFTFFRKSLRRS